MKLLLLIPLFHFVACGSGSETKNTVVISDPKPQVEPVSEIVVTTPKIIVPVIPMGAVTANFNGTNLPFYAYVKDVDKNNGITTIAFEKDKAPMLVLDETYGATLTMLHFNEFDSELLMINTKIDDPQFHKYHLYILKNGQWLPVVAPFAIHESHVNAALTPIIVDPKNPNNMFRYYSVFDIDDESDLGYTWRLFNESVAIKNR